MDELTIPELGLRDTLKYFINKEQNKKNILYNILLLVEKNSKF